MLGLFGIYIYIYIGHVHALDPLARVEATECRTGKCDLYKSQQFVIHGTNCF